MPFILMLFSLLLQQLTSGRRYVGVTGLADYLQTSPRHVRALVSRREIPVTRVGRLLRFDIDQVDAWLDNNTTPPGGGDAV